MKVYHSIETFPKNSFVATIGFFDGVHLGHRFLLDKLKKEAKTMGMQSMVISFEKHPKMIIPSDYIPRLITNNEEKIALLNEIGIDVCVLLPFDKEMANLTAYEFLKDIIVDKLGVNTLFVGYNHRFGKNRAEGINEYIAYGKSFGLRIIEGTSFQVNEDKISSSEIRRLIESGDVQKAASFLSYPYSLEGEVVEGQKIGRKLGFPTANISVYDKAKVMPCIGVYAVKVSVQNRSYRGMLNIGKRPTINANENIIIEVHILDFDKSIYHETIRVDFLQKIRDEMKFNSLDELKAEINKDKAFVLHLNENEFK